MIHRPEKRTGIETRYFKPTPSLGARIKASYDNQTHWVYCHMMHDFNDHLAAAKALYLKLGLGKQRLYDNPDFKHTFARFIDRSGYIFIPEDMRYIPDRTYLPDND